MLSMSSKLAISEVFYSIQGEGITMGIPSVFVRLGGCNLMCGGMGTQFDKELHSGATWRCDTVEVWMKAQSKDLDQVLDDECVEAIKQGAHVVITGGEPMMQQQAVGEFIKYILTNINENAWIEMETNGTIMPSEATLSMVNQFNCSPKLLNSGNDEAMTYRVDVIKKLNQHHTMFKFVVSNEKDWSEILEKYMPIVSRQKVWLMPAGENQELLSQTKQYVAELARDNYLNFTTRLHIEIWNQKTGV
jgi:7-carboxy-7-deazaguanine synthase